MPVTTALRGFGYSSRAGITTRIRGFGYIPDPPALTVGGASLFERAWKGGEGTLAVTLSSSEGHSSAIHCATHTIVISQSESQTQEIQLQLVDPLFALHPYGVGAHKDALVAGAILDLAVTYGGATRQFRGVMKPARGTRDKTNLPRYTWPGKCVGDGLFAQKKTLETLGGNFLKPAPTSRQALNEACAAVGVSCDWSGVRNQRLGGPYHRQNQTPGAMVTQVLNLTLARWRTEYRTVVGYDPETGGRIWIYDVELGDCVREHTFTPRDVDPIRRVKVLRTVPTGSVQTTGDVTVGTQMDEFGDTYSATFNPPVNHPTFQYVSRDYRGRASNFRWYRDGVEIARRASTTPGPLEGLPIWEADQVRWTWGADNPGVTMAGVTAAKGEIQFRGKPSSKGLIGSGENERGPIDQTLVRYRGDTSVPEEDAFELPPNPLLYGQAEMDYHGDQFIKYAGRQLEHPLRLPLNHMITLGDQIWLAKDRWLGGSGYIKLWVIAYQHIISRYVAQRQTTVTGVEYL